MYFRKANALPQLYHPCSPYRDFCETVTEKIKRREAQIVQISRWYTYVEDSKLIKPAGVGGGLPYEKIGDASRKN